MNFEEYKAVIKPFLSEKRYHHSICVSEAAVKLAKRYGADPLKAQTAGILHDIMKDLPPEQQLEKMKQYGIKLTEIELAAPKLWHAMLGAEYIKNELHIEDTEILNAVRYHTTGRKNMTPLERVLFMADFISADRDYPGVEELRKAAHKDMNTALLEGLSYTIADLANNKKPIHPDTFEAYNQIAMIMKENNSQKGMHL
jgi:predicted HD superfamily hydrolase involved in NAD metabolism